MNDVTIRKVFYFSKSFLHFLFFFFFYKFTWRTEFSFVYLGKLKRYDKRYLCFIKTYSKRNNLLMVIMLFNLFYELHSTIISINF